MYKLSRHTSCIFCHKKKRTIFSVIINLHMLARHRKGWEAQITMYVYMDVSTKLRIRIILETGIHGLASLNTYVHACTDNIQVNST